METLILKKGLVEDEFPSITFVKPPSSNLKCVECKNLLQRPKQTSCGHRLCHNCLETLKLRSPNGVALCPIDNTELTVNDIFHDKFCERDILQLECFCFNSKKGCEWKGTLVDLKVHVGKCEYMMVTCPNEGCSMTMEKRYLQDHVIKTCDYRLQACEYCGEEVSQPNLQNHHSECPKVTVQCIMGCGALLSRADIDRHVTNECPNAPVACPLRHLGCEFEGSRDDLERHNSDCVEKHIKIMAECDSRSEEKTKNMEEKIKVLESEKDLFEHQFDESKQVLALTKQDLQTLQIKVGIMEKHMEQHKNSIKEVKEMQQMSHGQTESETALQSQMAEVIELVRFQENRINDLIGRDDFGLGPKSCSYPSNIDRRLSRNDKMCTDHEMNITEHDLRIKFLEATSYDGTYIWKIDDWTRRMQEAQLGKTSSLYSAPFYVGRFGYKVCARLYPCGDGIGKGTHLSLFFVVMKGDYDSLLPWPFRQKITFKMIDPNRTNDIIDSFRPDPNSSSFQKPKSSMNIASGTPKLVPYKSLNSYIVDNTLYVKISVDRTGLVDL